MDISHPPIKDVHELINDAKTTDDILLRPDAPAGYVWTSKGNDTADFAPPQGGSGGGDMLKSTYDTNNNGIVDNAEKVNNHTVEKDVPSDADFSPYSVTKEELSSDKTLDENSKPIQILTTNTANRTVSILETPTKDLHFLILNNSERTTSYYILVVVGSDTNGIELHTGQSIEFIYSKADDSWIMTDGAIMAERTSSDTYTALKNQLVLGYKAYGKNNGVSLGGYSSGYDSGSATGYAAIGYNKGVASGFQSDGHGSGVANGYYAKGYDYGVANGTYAAALKQYGSATGYYSKQERMGGHAISGDHLATSKYHNEIVNWTALTSDDTQTEIFLHNVSGNRCTILSDSIVTFEILVTALDTTNDEYFSQKIIGCISNKAGVTALKGTITYTDICNTTSGTPVVTVEADDTNDALIIKVTGLASTDIRWGCRAVLIDVRK